MGQMLTTVACESGRDVFALLDTPLWQLLYTFHHLEERTARRALHDRLTRVDMALLNAHAFNDPKHLPDALEIVQAEIAAFERGPESAADLDAFRSRAMALAARMDAGRVLSSEALVS